MSCATWSNLNFLSFCLLIHNVEKNPITSIELLGELNALGNVNKALSTGSAFLQKKSKIQLQEILKTFWVSTELKQWDWNLTFLCKWTHNKACIPLPKIWAKNWTEEKENTHVLLISLIKGIPKKRRLCWIWVGNSQNYPQRACAVSWGSWRLEAEVSN